MGIELNVKTPNLEDDERALNVLKFTVSHIGDRYEFGLIWREPPIGLPNNRTAAIHRLYALERKLVKNPTNAKNYIRIVNEYVSLGHAVKDAASEANVTNTFYIPHHEVVSSGKMRVVFNASAIFQGSSLESFIFKGPGLLNDLIGILQGFRLRRVPISADIEKMFHRFGCWNQTNLICLLFGGLVWGYTSLLMLQKKHSEPQSTLERRASVVWTLVFSW